MFEQLEESVATSMRQRDGDASVAESPWGERTPPRARSLPGACIWFTGLSGAGKSTTASMLAGALESRGRTVTLLDGDVVRTVLSAGLGFSRSDRDANVRRIGFVAAQIVRHGGIVLCAAISPYRDTRAEVRAMFAPGTFLEVYVQCPVAVCEARDVKGLYAQARAGKIKHFTGIDDPYEPPESPELMLSTADATLQANVACILTLLARCGIVVA